MQVRSGRGFRGKLEETQALKVLTTFVPQRLKPLVNHHPTPPRPGLNAPDAIGTLTPRLLHHRSSALTPRRVFVSVPSIEACSDPSDQRRGTSAEQA